MTRSWSETARTALDGGRIWRGLVKRHGVDEADLGFRSTDMIVASLLRDLAGAEAIVCARDPLRELIQAVFEERAEEARAKTKDAKGRDAPASEGCIVAPDARPHILLTPIQELAEAPGGEAGCMAAVAYGVAGLVPPHAAPVSLRLLCCTAPALWQCGLALVVTADNAQAMRVLVDELALSMRGEWIDPLMLYERVQVLTAKLKVAGPIDDRGEAEPEGNRIFELEQELAALKRAALVNQHLMLVDAAERVRNPT